MLESVEEAALRLFSAQGFERTTIDQIAAAADISSRTFFRYFRGKEEVLFGYSGRVREALLEALWSGPADQPDHTVVRRALVTIGRLVEDDPHTRARLELVSLTPALEERRQYLYSQWAEQVAAVLGERAGHAKPTLRQRILARVGMVVLELAEDDWRLAGGTRRLEKGVERALDVLWRGLDV